MQLIHRDVSPQNIMVGVDGVAQMVLDLVATGDQLDLVSCRFQIVAQEERQRFLIFHNQNVRRRHHSPFGISPISSGA